MIAIGFSLLAAASIVVLSAIGLSVLVTQLQRMFNDGAYNYWRGRYWNWMVACLIISSLIAFPGYFIGKSEMQKINSHQVVKQTKTALMALGTLNQQFYKKNGYYTDSVNQLLPAEKDWR